MVLGRERGARGPDARSVPSGRGGRGWVPLALCAFLLGAFVLPGAPVSAAGARGGSPASQLANVRRLVETSSAARRIEASGNQEALAQRQEARGLFGRAEAALKAGKETEAGDLLKQVTRLMFQAVRLAGAGQVAENKKRRDYEGRKQSLGVLLTALRRIGTEKGEKAKVEAVARGAEARLSEAEGLARQGRWEQGHGLLDRAYEAVKLEIEALRSGDTLVRSLHFESAEQEYHYEVDRNDTHKMLVKVLVEEKNPGPGTMKMVSRFVDKAGRLRREAEDQAGRGDYPAAIRSLEASTKELVRAIRGAGIYIPG